MTRAIILAAGFGTRLGTLSDERPKPLLPVCDVPLIRYAVALLVGHGVTEIAVNLHHRGDLIEAELGTGADLGAQIRYSREEVILGTGGGLRRMGDWLTEGGQPFLVVNGKILIDVDLAALLERHARDGAAATMVLRDAADADKWGAIHVDDAGRVTGILDQGAPASFACMFTGVHVISPRLLDRLPEHGASDSIRQAYIPALLDGERISAVRYGGYFHEHSTPARYLEGNINALRGRARLRFPPGELTGVDPTAVVEEGAILLPPYRIGPGARVGARATVGPDAVVGRRAVVTEGARVTRAVLWPDTRADGEVAGAIVTPRGVFPVE